MQKCLKRVFVSVKVFWMFVLSLGLMIDENSTDVNDDSLEKVLKIFLTLTRKVYIISDIISSSMKYKIFPLFLDYVIQFLQNLFTCTTWKVHNFYFVVKTKTFLRNIIYPGVSGQYDFLFPTEKFCMNFFFSF